MYLADANLDRYYYSALPLMDQPAPGVNAGCFLPLFSHYDVQVVWFCCLLTMTILPRASSQNKYYFTKLLDPRSAAWQFAMSACLCCLLTITILPCASSQSKHYFTYLLDPRLVCFCYLLTMTILPRASSQNKYSFTSLLFAKCDLQSICCYCLLTMTILPRASSQNKYYFTNLLDPRSATWQFAMSACLCCLLTMTILPRASSHHHPHLLFHLKPHIHRAVQCL